MTAPRSLRPDAKLLAIEINPRRGEPYANLAKWVL